MIRGTVKQVTVVSIDGTPPWQGWLPLVVRPRRPNEPEILRFDDRMYEGGDDSVIEWSGSPRGDIEAALTDAHRQAARIRELEEGGDVS